MDWNQMKWFALAIFILAVLLAAAFAGTLVLFLMYLFN